MNRTLLLILVLCSLAAVSEGQGAVTSDGTMGTQVTQSLNNYAISAGTQAGGNLFHSFAQFNLSQGDIATFVNTPGIANIISRITGGRSTIDGLIRSNTSGANLYLLNPSGIVFGPNVSLDITGSFHASTADYLKLGSSGIFYADPNGQTNITVATAPPSAFGFLNPSPASITTNGSQLRVPLGQSISLVSGGISMADSNLWSYGGTINLVSVASAGEAVFTGSSLTPQGFSALGPVVITEGRAITSQPNYNGQYGMFGSMANLDASGQGGGNIIIRGGSFYLSGGTIFNDTYGNTDPGVTDITVNGNVTITRSNITGNAISGSKSGAAIAISGTNVLISDNSSINTDTFTTARGANITLRASESLVIGGPTTLDGPDTHVGANALGANSFNKAGDVLMEAPTVLIGASAEISTSAPTINVFQGYGAGAITINAGRSVTLLGKINSETASGSSGAITIRTGELNISGTGEISTSLLRNTASTPAKSGDINISAGNIAMSGDARIRSIAFKSNNGSSGDISITTGNLSLLERSVISTSIDSVSGTGGHINVTATGDILVASNPIGQVFEAGSIASDSTGGDAGHIRLEANNITITNGATLSTVARGATGNGGDITLIAHGTLTVDGATPGGAVSTPSTVRTDTLGGGAAGTINLAATNVLISNGGLVSSSAQPGSTGNGGNVNVVASNSLTVDGSGSSIRTDTLSTGTAGEIYLSAPQILVKDGGLVSSASLPGSTGAAGNITIAAAERLTIDNASISTQSAVSQGGSITISAPGIMDMINGDITASVKGGYGNGGNVTIDAGYLTLNDSSITAQAEWGNGGNLLISVDKLFIKSATSVLSASSRYGQQGTVVVNSPNTDVAGALAVPVFDILNLNAFIPRRCLAADELNASTFQILGNDGLPATPENSFPIM